MEGVDSSFAMNDAAQPTRPKLKKLPLFLVVIAALLILLLAPPFISIGQYKNRITGLISASLGRPVKLSAVELRLLPWPGFVMTDLSVAEDPAYGAEPVLHANTVRANIRLLSLWRGRLEISSISVDEATLNLVHSAPGKWNLDPLFRTAAAKAGATEHKAPLPYLEATNSRINVKDGAEKLPFSLVNTDLSFWQENPGEWRIRLRGQPARTDVVLDMGDTGILRLEASVRSAPALHLMPVHADLDWRDSQFGQLSLLVLGSDPGWRGDLTGEAHLDGTPEAAHISVRLSATGVHRAEFAPPAPLDFDANCGFVYHYSQRALDDLICNSPLGDGRLKLTGGIPSGGAPNLTLELDHVPAAAGLDALRTMRSGFAPDLEAGGTVSGKLDYAEPPRDAQQINSQQIKQKPHARPASKTTSGQPKSSNGPLTGSITIEGFTLSGGSLSQPLRVPRIVLGAAELTAPTTAAASAAKNAQGAEAQVLTGTLNIPAGGAAPLTLSVRLAPYGYQAIAHGQASIQRAREIAQLAGLNDSHLLGGLAGEPISISVTAEGPWLPNETAPALEPPTATPIPHSTVASGKTAARQSGTGPAQTDFDRGLRPAADTLVGTATLHNANWRADYLANRIQIVEATLHLGGMATVWDPIVFNYGPVKGTASLTLPTTCAASESSAPQATPKNATACEPQIQAQFSSLNAAVLQNAFLGARQPGTVLSKLIDRLSSSSVPPWPAMHGTIKADSVILGPLTLAHGSTSVEIIGNSADLTNMDAALLGGHFHGTGTLHWVSGNQQQPAYTIEGHMEQLSAPAVGQLLAMRWTGGAISLDGTVDVSGFTPADLAASAKGKLHFDWRHGAVTNGGADADAAASDIPPALAHFDEWSGDAKIADGAITLGENQVVAGRRNQSIHAAVQLANPPKVQFGEVNQAH